MKSEIIRHQILFCKLSSQFDILCWRHWIEMTLNHWNGSNLIIGGPVSKILWGLYTNLSHLHKKHRCFTALIEFTMSPMYFTDIHHISYYYFKSFLNGLETVHILENPGKNKSNQKRKTTIQAFKFLQLYKTFPSGAHVMLWKLPWC